LLLVLVVLLLLLLLLLLLVVVLLLSLLLSLLLLLQRERERERDDMACMAWNTCFPQKLHNISYRRVQNLLPQAVSFLLDERV
jgi:hypothetical protein